MKKYFEIKETIAAGYPDTARIIILYHPEIFGYLLCSPSADQLLKADIWEGSIHPDVFPEFVQAIKESLPESVRVESVVILTFPNAEIMLPGVIYDADHIKNWMECVRSRKTPNAPIEAGYQHSIATIMSNAAYRTGQRVTFDEKTQEVMAGDKVFKY